MKKTIWAISILALAVALSFLYRFGLCPHRLVDFPVLEDQKKINSPFSLYFFFSRHSCPACMEMADVLNRLTDDFPIVGVVPGNESVSLDSLKQKYRFRVIVLDRKLKRFLPLHSPSLVGVTSRGQVLFILPGVPGQARYLEDFLFALYQKAIIYAQ